MAYFDSQVSPISEGDEVLMIKQTNDCLLYSDIIPFFSKNFAKSKYTSKYSQKLLLLSLEDKVFLGLSLQSQVEKVILLKLLLRLGLLRNLPILFQRISYGLSQFKYFFDCINFLGGYQ